MLNTASSPKVIHSLMKIEVGNTLGSAGDVVISPSGISPRGALVDETFITLP